MVYFTKKIQAQDFKDSGYNEALAATYPYVFQYAEIASISPRQAAEDIIRKAQAGETLFVKTELLRLRYFKKIREAKTPQEVGVIHEEFLRDYYADIKVILQRETI